VKENLLRRRVIQLTPSKSEISIQEDWVVLIAICVLWGCYLDNHKPEDRDRNIYC